MTQCIMEKWHFLAIMTGTLWGLIAVILYGNGFKWDEFRKFIVDLNQFLFNFIGGASGWVCLRLVYNHGQATFGWIDLVLLLLAILGISGKLSAVLWKLPDAIAVKVESIAKS